VEHRNYELARVLVGRGHNVTLAGWTRDRQAPPGVTVLALKHRTEIYSRFGKRKASAAVRLAAAATSIDVREFDIVEAANIPYLHLFPLAAKCRLSGTPLVVSWYEYWGSYWREYVGRWKWPAYYFVEWQSAQIGAGTSAISSLTANRLNRARRRGTRTRLLPAGIPYDRIRQAAGQALEPGPPLVYAGRLQSEKRLDLLLEAIVELGRAREGVLLQVIGDGPDRERLEQYSRDLKVESSVLFTGRLGTQEEVWHRLGSARLAVQPSLREGFGMFPLEAMAAGLPVVYCASDESALPEMVREGVEGVCVQPEPATLAGAIDSLLTDEGRRETLAIGAARRARGYDWTAVGERVEGFMTEIVRLGTGKSA